MTLKKLAVIAIVVALLVAAVQALMVVVNYARVRSTLDDINVVKNINAVCWNSSLNTILTALCIHPHPFKGPNNRRTTKIIAYH